MRITTFYSATTQEELVGISQLKQDEIYTLTLSFTNEHYYKQCINRLEEKELNFVEIGDDTNKLEIYGLEFSNQEPGHNRFSYTFGDNIIIQIHRNQKTGDRIAFLYSPTALVK
jgi:hypothetical protein